MFSIYLLESVVDKTWYVGYTENLKERLIAHNSRKNISTKRKAPWKLIYCEGYLNKMDALGRERFLKSGSGHRFLKKQLKYYLEENISIIK